MKSSQGFGCAPKDIRLCAFDVHLDELDRVPGLANEFIQRDRRYLERTEIVAFGSRSRDEGRFLVRKIEADLSRTVGHGFPPDNDVLDVVQAHVFFQDPKICGKRFESKDHSLAANKPGKEKGVKSALCANIQHPGSRRDMLLD